MAGGPVTVAKLAAEYKPPTKNNMAALVKQLRKDSGDKTVNQDSWKVHFITEVLQHARTDEGKTAFLRDNDNGKWRLADGVDLGAVTYGDQLLIRPRQLPDLFNPETGAWRHGSRTPNPDGYSALTESMQAFGWQKALPAIEDENGVIIVGHRRVHVAKELGITPVIKKVTFGEGEAADKKRIELHVAANEGFEKPSPAERKKMAIVLYNGGRGLVMEKIAEKLRVSTKTISRDLSGLTNDKPRERGGRPRKSDPKSDPQAGSQAGSGALGDPSRRIRSGVVQTNGVAAQAGGGSQEEAGELTLFDEAEIEKAAAAAKPKPPKTSDRVVRFVQKHMVEAQYHLLVLGNLCTKKNYIKHMAALSRDEREIAKWMQEQVDGLADSVRDAFDFDRVPVQPALPGLDDGLVAAD